MERALAKLGPAMLNGRLVALFELLKGLINMYNVIFYEILIVFLFMFLMC